MKRWHFIAMAGLLLGAVAVSAAQVGLININGAIGPATESYIARAVNEAAAQNDECLVIQPDTPGGLLESTKSLQATRDGRSSSRYRGGRHPPRVLNVRRH